MCYATNVRGIIGSEKSLGIKLDKWAKVIDIYTS